MNGLQRDEYKNNVISKKCVHDKSHSDMYVLKYGQGTE
jgi:hypothetical protein